MVALLGLRDSFRVHLCAARAGLDRPGGCSRRHPACARVPIHHRGSVLSPSALAVSTGLAPHWGSRNELSGGGLLLAYLANPDHCPGRTLVARALLGRAP